MPLKTEILRFMYVSRGGAEEDFDQWLREHDEQTLHSVGHTSFDCSACGQDPEDCECELDPHECKACGEHVDECRCDAFDRRHSVHEHIGPYCIPRPEPQGEPSDAQVLEKVRAYADDRYGYKHGRVDSMRIASDLYAILGVEAPSPRLMERSDEAV